MNIASTHTKPIDRFLNKKLTKIIFILFLFNFEMVCGERKLLGLNYLIFFSCNSHIHSKLYLYLSILLIHVANLIHVQNHIFTKLMLNTFQQFYFSKRGVNKKL